MGFGLSGWDAKNPDSIAVSKYRVFVFMREMCITFWTWFPAHVQRAKLVQKDILSFILFKFKISLIVSLLGVFMVEVEN